MTGAVEGAPESMADIAFTSIAEPPPRIDGGAGAVCRSYGVTLSLKLTKYVMSI